MPKQDGLLEKYHITKADGSEVNPNAEYFVLRLDTQCPDYEHSIASRAAASVYASRIEPSLPKLAKDLREKHGLPGLSPVSNQALEHPLYEVLFDVINQVVHGKGERHGGGIIPFYEQPWYHYAKLHGRGFLTGQAAKKLEEAASLRSGEKFYNEVCGAIAYAAMSILFERELLKDQVENDSAE
jgi:hypothetical protein